MQKTRIPHDVGACADLNAAVSHLLAQRAPGSGFWPGRLCSSPLATATAVSALAAAAPEATRDLRRRGLAWLIESQNADGSWGDLPAPPGNLAATLLAVSALRLSDDVRPTGSETALRRAERFLTATAGASPESRREALVAFYGADRTFAVPIQVTAALAGLFEWPTIPRLPFELAVLPRSSYRLLRLQVVSYALPALIAIGLLLHARRPSGAPPIRGLRNLVTARALRRLARLQPTSGGFLEAIPLTAFVVLSLASCGHAGIEAVRRGIRFLIDTARADGSWAIDVELSGWVTALSVQALSAAPGVDPAIADWSTPTRDWLIRSQHTSRHPFTGATPGGWAWTPLPGGVPDADDTAGALIALRLLGTPPDAAPVRLGVHWLLDLQNRDGGWPTFCRGWNKLPFDRSAPDITAHVLRALRIAVGTGSDATRVRRARRRALLFLRRCRRSDGSWLPLWFGNPLAPNGENPVYGTALVLRSLLEIEQAPPGDSTAGIDYLLAAQNPDGGWGGAPGVPSTAEETGCVLTALCHRSNSSTEVRAACTRGAAWLTARIRDGTWCRPSPIGLYFAGLRYSEALYPIIWTVSGLGHASAVGIEPGK
ncbi:MAG: squalene--hopene cyclase [Kiritimatiellaeota bacterium]|nr:squalene--hopene cyclase [Kiritimatiellota bacterium]